MNNLDLVLHKAEVLRELIVKLSEDVKRIKTLQQTEIFSASTLENEKKERQVCLIAKIQSNSSTICAKLKEMEQEIDQDAKTISNTDNQSSAILRIKTTQHASLLHDFCEILQEYHASQIEHRDASKARFFKMMDITGNNFTEDQLEDAIEQGQLSVFTNGALAEMENAKHLLRDVQDRYEEIIKLENSIKDLKSLFWQLTIMVQSQGEMVDSITGHVETAQEFVSKGEKEVKTAKKIKNKGRKRKMKIGAVLGAIGAIVVVLIVVKIIIHNHNSLTGKTFTVE